VPIVSVAPVDPRGVLANTSSPQKLLPLSASADPVLDPVLVAAVVCLEPSRFVSRESSEVSALVSPCALVLSVSLPPVLPAPPVALNTFVLFVSTDDVASEEESFVLLLLSFLPPDPSNLKVNGLAAKLGMTRVVPVPVPVPVAVVEEEEEEEEEEKAEAGPAFSAAPLLVAVTPRPSSSFFLSACEDAPVCENRKPNCGFTYVEDAGFSSTAGGALAVTVAVDDGAAAVEVVVVVEV